MANDEMELEPFVRPVLGRYLGAGAFGFVFEEGNGSITHTALKIIISDSGISRYSSTDSILSLSKDSEMDRNRYREYNTMVDKRHKNIMGIISFSEVNYSTGEIQDLLREVGDQTRIGMCIWKGDRSDLLDTVVIRMELCGPTLRQWINLNVGRDLGEVSNFQVEIVQGLVEGLKYLHHNLIMHRDLKPDNIMFSYGVNDFRLPIKIGGFDLCRQIPGEESTWGSSLTLNIGTYLYQPPETFLETYSLQADLFSLGLTIWETLQLIPKADRRMLFEKLVYQHQIDLVKGHPQILNSEVMIVGLTKERVQDRIKHIDQVIFACSPNNTNIVDKVPLLSCLEGRAIQKWSQTKPRILTLSALALGLVMCAFVVLIVNSSLPDEEKITNFVKVSTTEELRSALSNSSIESIQLVASIFEVDFPIVLGSKRKLVGMGSDSSVIRNNLGCIECNNALNLLVVGNDCEVTGVEFSVVRNRSFDKIIFEGKGNKVADVVLNGVKVLITKASSGNDLSNLRFTNNPTETLTEILGDGEEDIGGIVVEGGSGHSISNVICQGHLCGLSLHPSSQNVTARGSRFNFVDLDGAHHHLINVNATTFLQIKGSHHIIENSSATSWLNEGSNVTIIDGNCVDTQR